MKKQYLFFAAAALSVGMASCSSDEMIGDSPQKSQAQALNDGGVYFDVYTQKATTRGGVKGTLTTDGLKTGDFKDTGFGVFGYYTDNNEYDQRNTPNFFYNQQVLWDDANTAWKYEPLKYWPNEYGSNAVSDDQDKVTYFAYAPWVDVTPTNGKLASAKNGEETWGITGMTKNSAQGDPVIKYIASFNHTKSVDLCWGVADEGDGQWPIMTGSTPQVIKNGLPWIDVERPAQTDQKVKFTFKHATAQMRMTIDADVDNFKPGEGIGRTHDEKVDKKSRIWVRSVTLRGIAQKGALNLNNEKAYEPYWLDYNGQNELVSEDVIVCDGRKDGKEGVNGSVATNEKVLGLNPAIVQDGMYTDSHDNTVNDAGNVVYDNTDAIKVTSLDQSGTDYERPGVTNTAVDLFADNDEGKNSAALSPGSKGNIFHVIPTGDEFEIEIVYDVETVDQNLAQNLSDGATKGSSVENRIIKKVTFGSQSKLQAGHSYTLALHLGMNSVKFDAEVTDWIDEPETFVDLPLNMPVYADAQKAFIDYDATAFNFALFGLNGGEPINVLADADYTDAKANSATGAIATTKLDWTASNNAVWANGYAPQVLTTNENPTTSKRTQTVTWTGGQSGEKVKVTFTQAAHPLGLKIETATKETTAITLTGTWTNNTYGWFCKGLDDDYALLSDADYANTDEKAKAVINDEARGIVVYINGVRLKQTENAANAGEFKFGDTSGEITLNANNKLVAGSKIVVYLKTGDAAVEMAQFTVAP